MTRKRRFAVGPSALAAAAPEPDPAADEPAGDAHATSKVSADIISAITSILPAAEVGALAGRLLNACSATDAFLLALDDPSLDALGEALGANFDPDATYAVGGQPTGMSPV